MAEVLDVEGISVEVTMEEDMAIMAGVGGGDGGEGEGGGDHLIIRSPTSVYRSGSYGINGPVLIESRKDMFFYRVHLSPGLFQNN